MYKAKKKELKECGMNPGEAGKILAPLAMAASESGKLYDSLASREL
jgi:hypothetical protein